MKEQVKQVLGFEQQWQRSVFWQWQRDYCPTNYIVAVSGGLDSMALLYLLANHRHLLNAPLTVTYVNHLWHDQAQKWGDFVAEQALALELSFQAKTVNYDSITQSSPEAMAREARYQVFADMMREKNVLLTAHQQDDQAETFLLQLLRGSGLAGLASMPERAEFAGGEHWRPLLGYSRKMLADYVKQKNIAYIDDPSNEDGRYRRNWLRKEVIPLLSTHHDSVKENMARSAAWLGEALSLQSYLLSSYFNDKEPERLRTHAWINEPFFLQKAVLREWLRRLNIPPLSSKQLESFLAQVQQGSGHPSLNHGQYVLVCHDDSLYAYRDVAIATPPLVSKLTQWQGIGELVIERGAEKLLTMADELTWSLYPPGGYFQPASAQHHHSLKEWFRRHRIPPYLRRRTPILRLNDKIIWVGGLGSAFDYAWLGINWQKKAHSVSISSYPLSVSDNS